MKRRASFLVPLVLFAAHCGGAANPGGQGVPSGATESGSPTPPPAGNGATELDGGVGSPSSGGEDGGACAAEDAPDDNAVDANCDGADGVVGRDVYVSVEKGSDTNVGTPAAPLRTLAAALSLATSRHGNVLVLGGSYPGDALSVAGTWAIYGGYQDGFRTAPKRELTILVAGDRGLLIDKADSATLAHLTVDGGEPSDPKQPTAHALRSKAARLVLDDDVLNAGDGVSMRAGKPGAPGQDGVNRQGPLTCNGVAQPPYANGTGPSFGQSAEGKPPGNLEAHVRAPQATAGGPGADGADAAGRLSINGDLVVGDVAERGHDDGKPGFGAASGGNSNSWPNMGIVWGGPGGSGGCPGFGGEGGVSGGSSVALLVLQGAATVQRSHFQTGIGGNGGDGGPGGAGGHGGWGGSPQGPGGVDFFPSTEHPVSVCKQPSDDPMALNCAAWGGIGGAGGDGGNGGGGAGGWSLGIVTVRSATASTDAATTMDLGPPGDGGRGNGGGRAPNGKRAQTFHLD